VNRPGQRHERGTASEVVETGQACGKAILLGEHAVVYGVPALAVGIERGVRAVATPCAGVSRLAVPGWGVEVAAGDRSDLGRALAAIAEASDLATSLAIEATVDLPPGGGLGCSAALGVAVARAIDPASDPETIAARVMAWERIFHGNPSGVDAAVASCGGCVEFTKGGESGGPARIEPVRLAAPLTVCIGHSGKSSSTVAMVESVARLRSERPQRVKEAFDAIRALVRAGRRALEWGDRASLGRLMDMNQMWLGALRLSTPAIDDLCRVARDHGAYGAKLTGAGGGGCVVAVVSGVPGAKHVLQGWRAAGFEGFATRVAPANVELEDIVESA
jgi:mevalonate kinase